MKKRILSFFLALFTVVQLVAMIPVVAEDKSLVGATVKLTAKIDAANAVHCYKEVTNTALSSAYVRVDSPSALPSLMKICDVVTYKGTVYYKLSTVDGSSHELFDSYPFMNSTYFEVVPDSENSKPIVTLNGKVTSDVTIYTNSKMPLAASMPDDFNGKVSWGWEILVDQEKELWVRIGDKVTNTCQLTYALVKNALNAYNVTKLRAVADDGKGGEYYSEPITVTVKEKPGTLLPFMDKVYAEGGGSIQSQNVTTNLVTITVNYIKVRPDGTRQKAAYENVRTMKVGYEAYTIVLPEVLGYYATQIAPSNPYNFADNPPSSKAITELTIPAGYTADRVYNIYYYPGQGTYQVIHYRQDLLTDAYIKFGETETKTATVAKPVPDCHQEVEGFQHLYYEHTEVAVDGSTVIEIYYEREYHTVIFDLVHQGAYGQESLYVKYGTEVLLNNVQAKGWEFDGWIETNENGDPLVPNPTPIKNQTITVTKSVYYKASYHGLSTTYTVAYWFEEADNGYHTIRYTEELDATSGDIVNWNEVIPAYIENNYHDIQFFTLDMPKTESTNRTLLNPVTGEYLNGVVVQGDGSTMVNVYFARRTYKITFTAEIPATGGHLEEHTHGDGSCVFNPMYCMHRHTSDCRTNGTCTKEEHVHTPACRECPYTQHIHGPECCSVHVHNAGCYSSDSDMETGFKNDASKKVKEYLDNTYGRVPLIGSFLSTVVNWFVNDEASRYAAEYALKIQSAAPPQNLQNGYIYVLEDQPVHIKRDGWIIDIDDIIYMDIPAIYIDGKWYYYTASAGETPVTGQIAKTNANVCTEHNHDHSGGCDYSTCSTPEHVHSDVGSYNCNKVAHTHSEYCNCTHIHEHDCYAYFCMKTEHNHSSDDGATGYQVIRTVIAKYGQDITAYVPYYNELEELGLHKNNSGELFTYWKYDSTGTDSTKATDRYVKHVTMVPELCYSQGIRTVAQYAPAAEVSPYVLFYLFESLDQTSAAKPFNYDDGSARQLFGTKYYDSNPAHMQVIMLDIGQDDASKTAAETQLKTEMNKTVYGMTPVRDAKNPIKSTVTPNEKPVTQYACFYDRLTTEDVWFHNNGVESFHFTQDANGNPLLYGASLKDVADSWIGKANWIGSQIGFNYTNPPLPDGFEPGAWEFAGWYTTPTINPATKVDWESATLTLGEINLFGLWQPVTRDVTVYEDYKLEEGKLLASYKIPNGNTLGQIDYSQSDYVKAGYTFAGWFYKDASGDEQRFYVNSFPVRHDMKIYAKWKMDKIVQYQINFVYQNGSTNEIVHPALVGNAVVGQNHTFFAKTGDELDLGYEEGYFPRVTSHTLMMEYNENADGTPQMLQYTFYYDKVEEVEYTIRYILKGVDEDKDGKDDEAHPYHKEKTRKAAVAELFLPIDGYTPDAYSKQLIISTSDPSQNVITFYYTENVEEKIKLFYHVHHMLENEFGGYDIFETREEVVTVDVGTNYPMAFAKLHNITNYEFKGRVEAKTRTWNTEGSHTEKEVLIPKEQLTERMGENGQTEYGYQLNEFGIEFFFYYEREKVGYTVEYKEVNKVDADGDVIPGQVFYTYDVPAENSVKFGTPVVVTINEQKRLEILLTYGYDLLDDTKTSITLYPNVDVSKNKVVFLFNKFDATFDYVSVGLPDNAVGLDNTNDQTPAGGDGSALRGSEPLVLESYYFAGWFIDAECKLPITAETIASNNYAVSLGADNKLMPTKTAVTVTPEGGGATQTGSLYVSDTYYALFLPRLSELTLKVDAHPNDSFLVTFTGREGTYAAGKTFTVAVLSNQTVTLTGVTVGIYDVTIDTVWSWRYDQIRDNNATVEVKVYEGGRLDMFIGSDRDQWMSDSTIGIYTPTNP